MRKRSFFKRAAALAATVTVVLGSASNLMAANLETTAYGYEEKTDTLYVEYYGSAECYLRNDFSNGVVRAYTYVDAADDSYYAYSYTDLEVDAIESGGRMTTVGSDSDSAEADRDDNDFKVTTMAVVYENLGYNILGLSAASTHIMEIDEVSDSCMLFSEVG